MTFWQNLFVLFAFFIVGANAYYWGYRQGHANGKDNADLALQQAYAKVMKDLKERNASDPNVIAKEQRNSANAWDGKNIRAPYHWEQK